MRPLDGNEDIDLPTRVARWVAAGIIDGRWAAGQRLNEVHLARETGISRAPVREALRTLSEQGMVTYRARVGCVVNGFTPQTVEDLYTVRAVLEHWCATEGTANLTTVDLEHLERYLVPMEAAWVRSDHTAFYTHAWTMREIIYGCSGNSVALDEIQKLRQRLHQLPLVLHQIPEHSEWVLNRHRTLVTAAKKGDADGVADVVVEVLVTAGQLVRQAYEARYNTRSQTQPASTGRAALAPASSAAL